MKVKRNNNQKVAIGILPVALVVATTGCGMFLSHAEESYNINYNIDSLTTQCLSEDLNDFLASYTFGPENAVEGTKVTLNNPNITVCENLEFAGWESTDAVIAVGTFDMPGNEIEVRGIWTEKEDEEQGDDTTGGTEDGKDDTTGGTDDGKDDTTGGTTSGDKDTNLPTIPDTGVLDKLPAPEEKNPFTGSNIGLFASILVGALTTLGSFAVISKKIKF